MQKLSNDYIGTTSEKFEIKTTKKTTIFKSERCFSMSQHWISKQKVKHKETNLSKLKTNFFDLTFLKIEKSAN